MGYNFWDRFGIMKGIEAQSLLERAVRLNWGGEKYYHETLSAGLSFRKQDVLFDYRRGSVIEPSKTLTGKAKADTWFDQVLEPMRATNSWTQAQAIDAWKEMERKMEEMEEFDEGEEAWWKEYEGLW